MGRWDDRPIVPSYYIKDCRILGEKVLFQSNSDFTVWEWYVLSTSPFLFHLKRGEPLTLEDMIVSSTSSDSGQPVNPTQALVSYKVFTKLQRNQMIKYHKMELESASR